MTIGKKGQLWIETVIYMLIGLALMALVLTFVVPKINEEKDRILVEQSIASLNVLDDKINEVISTGKDNRRTVEFSISKGELEINPSTNEITFTLNELTKSYSEPDVEIKEGRIAINTTQGRKTSSVNLILRYGQGIILKFDGASKSKKFNPSAIPYQFYIKNDGTTDIFQESQTYKAHLIDITERS